jgi:hypothetical protein
MQKDQKIFGSQKKIPTHFDLKNLDRKILKNFKNFLMQLGQEIFKKKKLKKKQKNKIT